MSLRDAAEQVRKAIEIEGRLPEYHQEIMHTHRKEWPTLWEALDNLITALRKERP